MESEPLFATSCGDHRFNDRLPDAGEEHYASWRSKLARYRNRLARIDPRPLAAPDRLNHGLFGRMLDSEIAALDQHGYHLPISKAGGFHTYLQFPASFSGADRAHLAQAAVRTIHGSVVPAYRALLQYIKNEYEPGARESISAAEFPEGAAFYQERIRYFTTLELSPEVIHRTGQE